MKCLVGVEMPRFGRGDYSATRLIADDAVTRLPSVEVEFRMKECGRATRGVSWAEVLIRQSVIPSGSNPVAISLQLRSPQIVQNESNNTRYPCKYEY